MCACISRHAAAGYWVKSELLACALQALILVIAARDPLLAQVIEVQNYKAGDLFPLLSQMSSLL